MARKRVVKRAETAAVPGFQPVEQVKESLYALEMEYENLGWERMVDAEKNWDFSRDFTRRNISLSRVLYIKNPLIRRAYRVQALYTFALGYTIKALHPKVQEVIDDFLGDARNCQEFGCQPALFEKEIELTMTGNLFFSFFVNPATGKVRMRSLEPDQITDIKRNPDDYAEPWYYLRTWQDVEGKAQQLYYPDADYNPISRPASIGGVKVDWNARVMHIKTGSLPRMKFGLPEIFSGFAYSQAYKKILEDWCTILDTHSRMAAQITGLKGKRGVAAARERLQSTVNKDNLPERNPSPGIGSLLAASGGVELKAIRTAGAATGPDESRSVRLMVAAAADMPDTFFGDGDIGNMATAETLDRPTELKMVNRQSLWKTIIWRVLKFVILQSALAEAGKLRQFGASVLANENAADGVIDMTLQMPKNDSEQFGPINEPIKTTVEVKFPPITERNVTERVRGVVGALTFMGNDVSRIWRNPRLVMRYVLEALGEQDPETVLDQIFPPGEDVGTVEDFEKPVAKPDALSKDGQGDGSGDQNGKPEPKAKKGKGLKK